MEELDKLQEELCVTLCMIEKYFPPSFFDIVVHLTVDLTREENNVVLYAFDGCIHSKGV